MTDGRLIDAHAHLIGERYLEAVTRATGRQPPLPPGTWSLLDRAMRDGQIDAAVLSTGPPGAVGKSVEAAAHVARTANEELANVIHDDPARFAGLALLPLPDVDAALEELEFALDELGLDGVTLFSHSMGIYLGDPRFDALFDELNQRGAYVFIHPTLPPVEAPLAADYPVWLYEFPFETTRAVANLVFSGTLERSPSIRFQLAHLGGTIPFLASRLASLQEREPERLTSAPLPATAYFERLFYDSGLANEPLPLHAAIELAGPGRIVFGTDWPYATLTADASPASGFSTFDPELRAAVQHRNITQLVPRWG